MPSCGLGSLHLPRRGELCRCAGTQGVPSATTRLGGDTRVVEAPTAVREHVGLAEVLGSARQVLLEEENVQRA